MTHKRLTLFAGHYGSGKTNIALNYARWLRRQGEAVTVADLDIVNPYFRTKDSEEDLKKEGIGLIVSPFANSNLDVPAMPKETYALIAERGECGVLDIGGDDRGALALGRYVPEIRAEGDYEMLFVINRARPLTRTVEDTILVLREIEAACGLPFTAIVTRIPFLWGVTAALTDLGLRVPEDVSIVSMGDRQELEFYRPELTYLKVPLRDHAIQAFELVKERLENPALPVLYTMITPEFVEGKTLRTLKK